MALETGTYISDLVSTNPPASDPKSQGDDHLRLIKSTVKATFPNISGAVTPTHIELNYVDGVTSAIQAQLDAKGAITGQAWTGNHTFPTQTAGDNSTKAATTAYADAADALKASLSGATYTGAHNFTGGTMTVAAPTAGSNPATKTYADALAFSAALPGQAGNSGKLVTTDGSSASWTAIKTVNNTSLLGSGNIDAKVANIVTATTATTLTSTPTLLQITPASYGVAVTLPDATTCTEGGPIHIIDNKGAYPVKVLNSAGTLIGFIYGGIVSHVSLIDNSAAAGTWSVENSELVGASAQLLTVNINSIQSCIALDSDREFILANGSSSYSYGVVYTKSTNTFGSVTAIRSAATAGAHAAILQTTDRVLVISCTSGADAFEAVICSISGTTITPNTAATTTLSAGFSGFADGCGLIAVGTSWVTSYTVTTPAAQIRAISVSGTTVTIGSAEVLDGTAGGLIAASGDKVIAVSTATTHLYTKPYTVSGSTLSAGAGTDTSAGTMGLNCLTPLGTRFYLGYKDDATSVNAGIISLSGTTTTISVVTGVCATSLYRDAIVVGSNKVLVLGSATTNNCNLVTDTAGTASAGTSITLSSQTSRRCLYVSGTAVAVQEGTTTYLAHMVDCSGASPVKTKSLLISGGVALTTAETEGFSASNAVLSRSPYAVYGAAFAQTVSRANATVNSASRVKGGEFSRVFPTNQVYSYEYLYRGVSAAEVWGPDGSTVITKIELAVGALS